MRSHLALAEGGRWAGTVEQLRGDYKVLTGDMLLAAAFISYAGPFSSKYRWVGRWVGSVCGWVIVWAC